MSGGVILFKDVPFLSFVLTDPQNLEELLFQPLDFPGDQEYPDP